jgi:FtsP/CotA-like multicopper oxidase with cupredoxin domain
VINDSTVPDLVHWHGLKIPSLVDGAMEEGTPMILRGQSASYTFTPRPAGTRWYHTHATAKDDLRLSLYGGQYGFLYVESVHDPGRYDQEIFIAMHPNPHSSACRIFTTGRRRIMAWRSPINPPPLNVDMLVLAPAERIDAIVEMNNPGVWVFGSIKDDERSSGLGIVIEYANATGDAQWRAMEKAGMPMWNYLKFGANAPAREPDGRFELLSQKILGGRGGFNRWTINGKSWPNTDPLMVERGKRYRLVFNNDSGDMHPMHLHRHSFELVKFDGKPTSGIIKDVVNVPAHKIVEVDFVADNPGLTLLHCHMQEHMDFGFMNLVKYIL